MLFKIRGTLYDITAGAIVSAAKDVPPDAPNGMNKYYVAFEDGR